MDSRIDAENRHLLHLWVPSGSGLSTPPAYRKQRNPLSCVQSACGAVEMSVFCPIPMDMLAQDGERVRVAGVMLSTGSTPLLMLPMGPKVEAAVALCSQGIHARQMK